MANNTNSGITWLGLLGVVFITLKLIGAIHWSWWWVTAPLWGGWALVLAIVLLAIVFKLIGALIESARGES